MRAHGPFKVYDHAKAKGQEFVQNLTETNLQAQQRFDLECQKLKEVREFEKQQFHWQKKKQDIIAEHKDKLKIKNNAMNLA